ncbi:phasin, PhaP [Maritimibacter sp. 55A14]|uniref:phasin, PhaP n=1 Tax=Maritimibacter sp. 55A14 TaxID=2174844 RepID=UPI000D61EE27|nr:phasin, PhaP [Maritimibacter sp. 55A14]PWE32072.1 phasin, PhaP [Maritimibacter sp. 55A14]
MTKAQDYTKAFTDMMEAIPMDFSAVESAMKSSAVLGEKLSKVALIAAEQSLDIQTAWTKDTLGKLSTATKAQKEPADYTKVASDFVQSSSEAAAEQLAAFAEVAKKAQMETVELLLASGKEATEEATAAVKKATAEFAPAGGAKKTAKTAA